LSGVRALVAASKAPGLPKTAGATNINATALTWTERIFIFFTATRWANNIPRNPVGSENSSEFDEFRIDPGIVDQPKVPSTTSRSTSIHERSGIRSKIVGRPCNDSPVVRVSHRARV